MGQTDFNYKIKIQDILENQIPEQIHVDNPKFAEFLQQYYISQEIQGGSVDLIDNLVNYLNLDNLTPEVISGTYTLSSGISSTDTTISVSSTKGFPDTYGLLKIDDEIITYKSKTATSFVDCVRGFSGIVEHGKTLTFSSTNAASHSSGISVSNLSVAFLNEIYQNTKFLLLNELESTALTSSLNVNNFLKNTKSLYQSKGTKESIRILFNALYGITPQVVDLEQFVAKSSNAEYVRRSEVLFQAVSGDNPQNLIGQEIIKNTDNSIRGTVSEIEIYTRSDQVFYKFYFFIGYSDDTSSGIDDFEVTPSSKVVHSIATTDNTKTLTVDSTVNFPESGSFFYKNTEIFYTEKSLNQFFGCYTEGDTYINTNIPKSSVINSNLTYFGYEGGDQTKKVSLRLIGTISEVKFSESSSNSRYVFTEDQTINVGNFGKIINNPNAAQTTNEIFANSLIYNTSTRYQLNEFSAPSNFAITLATIDSTSLKVGDQVEFLERGTEIVPQGLDNVTITSIDFNSFTLEFSESLSNLNVNKKYDIRRLTKFASASIGLEYDNISADISNLYEEDIENYYIASNSLPSYNITKTLTSSDVASLTDYDSFEKKYKSILLTSLTSLVSGDKIYYSHTGDDPIGGLSEGTYYITVDIDSNSLTKYLKVKLYASLSSIASGKFIYLDAGLQDTVQDVFPITSGTHTFTLNSQKTASGKISPQKLFKKIRLNGPLSDSSTEELSSENIGILANGVEIKSYKSPDIHYYGPIHKVDVLSSGNGFDVINPPQLSVGVGTAKIQPVVRGSVEEVVVMPHSFEVEEPINIKVTGGNGKNVSLKPITRSTSRDVFFNARVLDDNGGLSVDDETITFLTVHNFYNGQKVYYDKNDISNPSIGIGNYKGSDSINTGTLTNNASYYVHVINDRTVQLYPTLSDYNAGINTVGFTTTGNFGIHKFKTAPAKVLDKVVVESGGEGFENRKLIVKPVGISTILDTITFKNHGFSTGELLSYSTDGTAIAGLSTANQYYVLKINDDSFRLCNAGVGGTDVQYFNRQKYANFTSTGVGYQNFNYPDIQVTATYIATASQSTESIDCRAVVTGSIVDAYLYEGGVGYGSTLVNIEEVNKLKVLNGKNAEITPIVTNGVITSAVISYGGVEYYSTPILEVIDSKGVGAILFAETSNGRITKVTVIEGGSNYSVDTSVKVIPRGKDLTALPRIRPLNVNNAYKYGTQFTNRRDPSFEILEANKNGELQYLISGYQEKLRSVFNDTSGHSQIIGWSYDGNPIYGPFGYSDPNDAQSPIKLMTPSYELDTSNVVDRLSTVDFVPGYFLEDYKYTGSGDLDEFNGRFCKTPEFPLGVYAYFATASLNTEGEYVGKFPYFIKKYRSLPLVENKNSISLNQSFDFSNTSLLRNTNPYKEGADHASYDFFVTDKSLKQIISATTPSKGVVDGFNITEPGDRFKVDDTISFKSVDGFGSGLTVKVSEVKGKTINSITTRNNKYTGAKFYKNNNSSSFFRILPSHDLKSGSKVFIAGLSTERDSLNDVYEITVANFETNLTDEVSDGGTNYNVSGSYHAGVTGIVTDIKLDNIPSNVAIGGSIKITGTGTYAYDQYYTIHNYFPEYNIIRAKKTGINGISTAGSVVTFLPNTIFIDAFQGSQTSPENYKRYFNPARSIGIGTQGGTTHIAETYIGSKVISQPIPTRSIYLPNHGFRTRQKVKINKPAAPQSSAAINGQNAVGEGVFDIFAGSTSREVYIISKSDDYIGIVTNVGLTTTSEGVFFPNATGSDNHEYYFETLETEETCEINQITSKVAVSTAHGLKNDDLIKLNVVPKLNVGIGETTFAKVKYFPSFKALSLKEISFNSDDFDVSTNKINIVNHGLETGDKVYYISTSVLSGLSTDTYYVSKVDTDNIRLAETQIDALNYPPKVIEIGSTDTADQSLYLLNPKIDLIRKNNFVFDVSDTSLSGYNFNLYYDKDLTREFISVGSTTSLSVLGVGTVGVSTNATVTLTYNDRLPRELYYGISNSTETVKPLSEVKNSSKITYNDSVYNGEYRIFNKQDTSFDIFMGRYLERLTYTSSDCDSLSYTTKSKDVDGPVNKLSIISEGSGYTNLPYYSATNSENGYGLSIIPTSNTIGQVNKYDLLNSGFEYSSDVTLRPRLFTDKNITLRNSKEINTISVTYGGRKYPSAPDLVIVNSTTGELIDNGLISAQMSGGELGTASIEDVNIEVIPRGMPSSPVTVRAINNSNGIRVDKITSSTVGLMTCLLKTPILGFPQDPFEVGDKVFVEQVEIVGTGTGFNSADHGYSFFNVTSVEEGSNPFEMEIQIPKLYGTPGVAVTFQVNSFATIIDEDNYPTFKVEQDYSNFFTGESLTIINSDNTHTETDLVVEFATENYVKIKGNYVIRVGDVFRGTASSSVATVESLDEIDGRVNISQKTFKELGWQSDSGKTNTDTQFISDNDYYQNLSYTIKSPKTWDEISSPVNSTVHVAGTKNFADTQLDQSANVSIGDTVSSIVDITQNFISQSRTDVIKNFDIVRDFDVNYDISKFIQFKNLKLSNFNIAKTNRVLNIDDISGLFSSTDDSTTRTDAIIKELSISNSYDKFLIQIKATDLSVTKNLDYNHVQLSELIVLNDGENSFYLEKITLTNHSDSSNPSIYGEIVPELTDVGTFTLLFKPSNSLDIDYEVKVLSHEHTKTVDSDADVSFGHINNRYFVDVVSPDTSSNIVSLENTSDAFVAEMQIVNASTEKSEYLEIYGLHDGTDTNYSIFKFDGDENDITITGISTSIDVELVNNRFNLKYTNYTSNNSIVRTKITTFDDPDAGISTYKFKTNRQASDSIRTVQIDSKIDSITGNTTIRSYDRDLFTSVKGVVKVSCGNTSSLHQIACLHDDYDSHLVEYPLLAIGDDNGFGTNNEHQGYNGIGTFGSTLDSNNLNIVFYPDSEYVGSAVSISQFNTAFYTFFDELNLPNELITDTSLEEFTIAKYIGKNSEFANRLNFPLKYEQNPIFEKSFDPNDTNALNPTTGVFTIKDHFFSDRERLIYTPDSTFIGIGKSAMHINSSTDINGITTTLLPTDVFAIKLSNDTFKIATNETNAENEVGVTFPELGLGNAHKFEMFKKNEKVLIAINDLVQYPVIGIGVSHTLENNDGGEIGVGNTYIALSGISSVRPTDILKIDNEYMKVTNVGLGTTLSPTDGNSPIEFSGDISIVEVDRAFLGSAATTHTDNTQVDVFRGSYLITGDEIHFSHPPRGSLSDLVTRDERNLERERSTFSGRVFLRQDYTSNEIYDDFSYDFNGTRTNFNLSVGGVSTVGFGTTSGNGVLFINGIFQKPLTQNSSNHNFEITQDTNAGITSVTFTGVRNDLDQLTISESDINQNQLPRGGIIVSLGSTAGLGYAPLYGAQVLLKTDSNGTITDVVGTATTYQSIGVTTASYDEIRGIVTITASQEDVYKLRKSRRNRVKLVGLAWTCDSNPGIVSFFPSRPNDAFDVVGLGTLTFSVDVGISTLKHYYSGDSSVGFGTVHPFHDTLNFGSGYRDQTIDMELVDYAKDYVHKFVSATPSAVQSGGDYDHTFVSAVANGVTSNLGNLPNAVTDVTYNASTGDLVITSASHGLSTSNTISIADNALSFTCTGDNNGATKTYPRSTDPASGASLAISAVTTNTITVNVGTSPIVNHDVTFATYDPTSGDLVLTIENHGLTTAEAVGIYTGRITFTCSSDDHITKFNYPRATDPLAGIITQITATTTNTITVNAGSMVGSGGNISVTVGAGGTLAFTIADGGSGYTEPSLHIEPPVYEHLEMTGVSRLGIGQTTETGIGMLMNVSIGPSIDNGATGIGTTMFEVSSFKVTRPGYAFQKGDVIKPVGLVTAAGLSEPVEEFQLFVLDTYNDNVACWQFGEMNLIDSVKRYQNGTRTAFPLYYNGEILSFQRDVDDPDSEVIDFNSLLVIFLNGVLQQPNYAYEFSGGSAVRFLSPPKENDDVQIYFYVGTRGVDSQLIRVNETIKIGDTVQVYQDNGNLQDTTTQDPRLAFDIFSADILETNLYNKQGIDEVLYRPLHWVRQKEDIIINEFTYPKTRDSIEPQIYPTARVIGNVSTTDTEIFVDDISIFNYEDNLSVDKFNMVLVPEQSNRVAISTATVSNDGTINNFTVDDGGVGYTTATVNISNPIIGIGTNRSWYAAGIGTSGDVGIGTTAVASLTITNGSITSVNVVNAGSGYTSTNLPQVIISDPSAQYESLKNANVVTGFSGGIIGIGTTVGIGTDLALKFELHRQNGVYSGLEVGNPIYVFDTHVGSGLTSIETNESDTVGVSTQFVNNVYTIHAVDTTLGIITCNISDQTNIVGIATTGTANKPIGKYSWGKISGFGRGTSPISIGVTGYDVTSGLSTFPLVQRRGFGGLVESYAMGLRDTGSLSKTLDS